MDSKNIAIKNKEKETKINKFYGMLRSFSLIMERSNSNDYLSALKDYYILLQDISNNDIYPNVTDDETEGFRICMENLVSSKQFHTCLTLLETIVVGLATLNEYKINDECMIIAGIKNEPAHARTIRDYVYTLNKLRRSTIFQIRKDIDKYMKTLEEDDLNLGKSQLLINTCMKLERNSFLVLTRIINYYSMSLFEKKRCLEEQTDSFVEDLTLNLCQHPPNDLDDASVSKWSQFLELYGLKQIPECPADYQCYMCLGKMTDFGTNHAIQNCCPHIFCLRCYEEKILYKKVTEHSCSICQLSVAAWTTRNHYNAALSHRLELMKRIGNISSSKKVISIDESSGIRADNELYKYWLAADQVHHGVN